MSGTYEQLKHSFFNQKILGERNKNSLRSFYRNQVKDLSFELRKQKQEKLSELLKKLPLWKSARFIAGYQALKDEPDLSSFYKLFEDKICFPLIQGDKLEFYTNRKKEWKKNKFQILEPVAHEKNHVSLKDISVFLVPGRVFDRSGGRLGRGMAFYDKTLKVLKKENPSNVLLKGKRKELVFIGVAFSEQVHGSSLPLTTQDVLMDILVTDSFVLMPLHSKRTAPKAKKRGLL